MPSASPISVSVRPARSMRRCQSALLRGGRETSRPSTGPTWAGSSHAPSLPFSFAGASASMRAMRRASTPSAAIRAASSSSYIYLHYALDLWAVRWRQRETTGDMIIVRYADDFIIGFQHESDARRFLDEMRERLQ